MRVPPLEQRGDESRVRELEEAPERAGSVRVVLGQRPARAAHPAGLAQLVRVVVRLGRGERGERLGRPLRHPRRQLADVRLLDDVEELVADGRAQAAERDGLPAVEVRREHDERAVAGCRRREPCSRRGRTGARRGRRPAARRGRLVGERHAEAALRVGVERRVGGRRDLLDVVGHAVRVVVVERRRVRAARDPVDDDVLAGVGKRGGLVRELPAARRPELDSRPGRPGRAENGGGESGGERGAREHAGTTRCGVAGYAACRRRAGGGTLAARKGDRNVDSDQGRPRDHGRRRLRRRPLRRGRAHLADRRVARRRRRPGDRRDRQVRAPGHGRSAHAPRHAVRRDGHRGRLRVGARRGGVRRHDDARRLLHPDAGRELRRGARDLARQARGEGADRQRLPHRGHRPARGRLARGARVAARSRASPRTSSSWPTRAR